MEISIPDVDKGSNRWYVLVLSTLLIGLGFALPTMCIPVLFKEIVSELGLNLVEVGTVWGMISMAGILTSLIGGILGDHFGLKRIITVACFLTGLSGAIRGLSNDFFSLAATSFIFAFLSSLLMVNVPKIARIWFSRRQFALANGVHASGMSIGFTFGAMFSATVISPWLGGWRNVLFAYGLVTVFFGIIWMITVREPGTKRNSDSPPLPSIREAIAHVSRFRGIWLLGLAFAGYLGCLQGVTGYLPLYLYNIGWSAASADGALAAFNIAGAVGAVPVALLSDRLGLRKIILSMVLIIAIAGTTLLAIFTNEVVWVLAVLIGFTRESAMMLFIVMTMENKAVAVAYAGTAMGLLHTISRIGGGISPPVGNSLASIDVSIPYYFWASLALIGLIILCFIRETRREADGLS